MPGAYQFQELNTANECFDSPHRCFARNRNAKAVGLKAPNALFSRKETRPKNVNLIDRACHSDCSTRIVTLLGTHASPACRLHGEKPFLTTERSRFLGMSRVVANRSQNQFRSSHCGKRQRNVMISNMPDHVTNLKTISFFPEAVVDLNLLLLSGQLC